jgi:hypothetical protein
MDAVTFATAYGLSTSIGLRPFLTLALASLAMHLGYLHVSAAFAGIGTDGATILLAGLAVLEFIADKVPAVDHALHALHFGIKPIAAALLVGGALGGADPNASPDGLTFAAMGLGALNALGVHSGVTAVRAASSAFSVGLANPFFSFFEDAMSICVTVLAIALPFVGAAIAIAIAVAAIVVVRVLYLELRKRRAVAGPQNVVGTSIAPTM